VYSDTEFSDSDGRNILVIGNSFARDVINILTETYDVAFYNLKYSPTLTDCTLLDVENRSTFDRSDLILFASGYDDQTCINEIIERLADDQHVYFLGDKHFGYNLNWILRISEGSRGLLRNPVTLDFVAREKELQRLVPKDRFISLTGALIDSEGILITDENGRLISDDRRHLTLSGARFVGNTVIRSSNLDRFFSR
jgi:hypothetical protein